MKKLIFLSFCFLFTFSSVELFAQNVSHYNDNWMFADQHSYNFTSGTPSYVAGTAVSNPNTEGVSAISDGFGNILFYSDAESVYDANNNPMPNGNGTINGYISATNACLITKIPGDCDRYYLFTIQEPVPGTYQYELRYSVIDMSLNGGLGDVIAAQNNVLMYTASDITEKMISVQKGLTEDYWIIVRKTLSDEFLSFEVSSAGINNTPVVSLVSSNTYSFTPTPAVTPIFGWLAGSPFNDAIIETSGFTNSCLYDFDNLTGVLSNQEVLINNPYSPPTVMTFLLGNGCAFSPDGQIIYMSVFDGTTNSGFMYRFDRSGGSGTVAATLQTSAIPSLYATIQARNDGKIYFNMGTEPGLSVITDPNNFSTPNVLLNNYMFPSGVADISLANDFKLWAEQILPTNIAGYDTTLCTSGPVDLGCSSCDSIGASYFWEPAALVINPNNKTTQTISLSSSQTFMVHVMYCGDTISTDTMDVTINNASVGTDTQEECEEFTWIDGNTYTESNNTATFVIPNAVGCDSTITLNLTINALTTLDAGSNQTVCEGTDVTLTATGAAAYDWEDGIQNGVAFSAELGSNTYTVEGTDANGCEDEQSVTITGTPYPELIFEVTDPACQGESSGNIVAVASNGTAPYSFVWNNGMLQAENNGVGAGTYEVTVTDDNECETQGSVVVIDPTEPCFFIPGGLSPNGDGTNETWSIGGLSEYPEAKVSVFNRWGQQVYTGDYSTAAWDGTSNGNDLPTADYYYILDLGNGEKYNGVVTLKR
ncbi:MAG: gliding motility-associated C-terminal domain-containing protein [Crocinitomicaceae bacterium]|nr:gliding motility-associated C-terminal domain-containing protein [Crocinitomicaceae bacterium]